jgi:peptidyl-prolyl cis-trans isomerase D
MFDLFRSREKSVRILLGVLLGLVALSMLVYLIPGGPVGGGATGENVVAVVGGDKITATDVQRAIQNVTRGQQNLPPSLIGMYVPMIINQMIENKAMAYKAREMGLRVSDQELSDAIQGELVGVMGGSFNMDLYQRLLAEQGMTVPDFEKTRREALLAARLENLESQSLIVSDQDARAEYQRKNLKVGLQYIEFDSKDFLSKVNKDPAQAKAYFEKNRFQFRTPEKRDVELLVGSNAEFLETAHVSDADLKREYQDNIDSYRTPERVQVRHILIKTQGKPKEDVPKLKAKAEDLLKQLQHGADFAELAKKNSEDPGSAEKGGELGWVVRGMTVPNFEKTAFSLTPGQTSGVIETEYGFHIIQVEAKQAAHMQSFDEVKPQLLADAQKQLAADNLKKAMEAARAEIIRTPAQADAIAAKYHLKLYKLTNLAAGQNLPDVNNVPELNNAVFAAAKGGVTDVVDVPNQGKEAFALITNVSPAHNAAYQDVEADVMQRYTNSEASRLAQDAAKSAADEAKKGKSLEEIAHQYGLQVKTAAPFTIDGAAEGIGAATMLSSAFKANVGDVVGPVSAQAGQFVCKVTQKTPADMTKFANSKQEIVQTLTQQRVALQQPLFRASIVDELTRRGKIKRNQATLERIVSSYKS